MLLLKRNMGVCVKEWLGPGIDWAAIWGTYYFWIPTFSFLLHFRQKIERSTLTGTQREVIVNTVFHPFSLTLYGQYIYWTDWNTQKIYRANKYDGSGQMALTMSLPFRPNGIRVAIEYHHQPQCSNPCSEFNGGCSHICAPGKALPVKIESHRVIMMIGGEGCGIFSSNRGKSPNSPSFQGNS